MSDLPILSASRLKDAKTCQRLHHYRYDLQYRPAEDAATLRFGTLLHLALEQWWSTTRDDERLGAALAAVAADESDPYDRARAEALIRAYDARWLDEMQHLDVIGVEIEFRAPLVNPDTRAPSRTWQLGGKLDVLVHDKRTNRNEVYEHKSTSESCGPGSDYLKRLRLDGQISMYMAGAEALGVRPDAVTYDVIRKPALRPKMATPLEERKFTKDGALYKTQRDTDETPDEFRDRCIEDVAAKVNDYLVRAEVVRLDGELDEAMADVWQIGKMLHENGRRSFFPRTVENCNRYNRTCSFFGVCCHEASLEDTNLFRRLDTAHPELEAAIASGS